MDEGTRIQLHHADGPQGGWLFSGTAPGAPGLLVLASIYGGDAGTLGWAREIASRGGPVAVPDLFWRQDPGPCDLSPEGRGRAFSRRRAFDDGQGLVELAAWAAHLRAAPGACGRIAALGICFGGHLAVSLAASGAVDAAVSVHGAGLERVLTALEGARPPLALHFGAEDALIPTSTVEEIRAALGDRPEVQISVHPGAGHGFAHPGSPNFQRAAFAASDASLRVILDGLR